MLSERESCCCCVAALLSDVDISLHWGEMSRCSFWWCCKKKALGRSREVRAAAFSPRNDSQVLLLHTTMAFPVFGMILRNNSAAVNPKSETVAAAAATARSHLLLLMSHSIRTLFMTSLTTHSSSKATALLEIPNTGQQQHYSGSFPARSICNRTLFDAETELMH